MKARKKDDRVKMGALEYDSMELAGLATPEPELLKRNYTHDFYREFAIILQSKELLNIQILGEVVKGKSTVMCALLDDGNKILGKEMSLEMIAADQTEYAIKIRNAKYNNCVTGIDEWSEVGNTGYGSTSEQSYLETVFAVQAQRKIHRISCSPRKIIDANANIILLVLNKDEKRKMTRCILYYRRNTPLGSRIQMLGYVDVDVRQVLKKEWYSSYRRRKEMKWDLVNKEGVAATRNLEYSEIILKIYNASYNFAKHSRITDTMIKSWVEAYREETLLSIPAEYNIAEHVMGLLKVTSEIRNIEGRREKIRNLKGINPLEKENTIKELTVAIEQAKDLLNRAIDRYKRMAKIYKEYCSI